MDFKDMRFVVAVYEVRSFSAAAQRLGTVQSNVSDRIRKLERSLGTVLFERLWRTVVPTAQGAKVYRFAVGVLAKLSEMEQKFGVSATRGRRPSRRKRGAAPGVRRLRRPHRRGRRA